MWNIFKVSELVRVPKDWLRGIMNMVQTGVDYLPDDPEAAKVNLIAALIALSPLVQDE